MNDTANLERVWMNLEPEFVDGKSGRKNRIGKIGKMYPNMSRYPKARRNTTTA